MGESRADPFDTWQWRNPLPNGDYLSDIIFANNVFVAVGANGTVMSSPDGRAWTQRPSGTIQFLESITYGNGTFVAVGDFTVATSTNGLIWTQQSVTVDGS